MSLDAIIAKALASLYGLPLDPPSGEIDGIMAARYERVQAQTQAVRDALLAEGRTSWEGPSGLVYPYERGRPPKRVLVIPLDACLSPRPNQHQETP